MKARVNLTIEKEIRDRAHAAGLNISRVAADAVLRAVQALEKEAGTSSAKITAPAIRSHGGTPKCQLQTC